MVFHVQLDFCTGSSENAHMFQGSIAADMPIHAFSGLCSSRRTVLSSRGIIMKEQSSFKEWAKFSQRILRSRWRILQSPMANEHPAC